MLFPSSFAVSRRAKLSQLVDFASHMAHNSPTRFHKERKRKSKLTSNLNAMIEGIQTNARVYRIKKYFDASHVTQCLSVVSCTSTGHNCDNKVRIFNCSLVLAKCNSRLSVKMIRQFEMHRNQGSQILSNYNLKKARTTIVRN